MRSKIEANEYKDYILGFIFYKFLSENEVMRLKDTDFTEDDLLLLTEDNPDIVEGVQDECGYFISLMTTCSPHGSKRATISRFPTCVMRFRRSPATSIRRVRECSNGIFPYLQTGLSKLGTDARSQSKAARDLIYLIKDIPMDSRQDYDVLGIHLRISHLSNFAANAGKKAGEFYTPSEVSQLMSEIVAWHLQGREQIKIYDPTSGSGSLLIHIGQSVARRNGNLNSIMYYAQELKENTYNLTRMGPR